MTIISSLLVALLAQGQALPGDPRAQPAPIERPARTRAEAAPAQAQPPAARNPCAARAGTDPAGALLEAETLARTAKGAAAVDAAECRALALSGLGHWDKAEAAFVAGRDLLPAGDRRRADFATAAAIAAESAGDYARALALFDAAAADAAGDRALAGRIARDRAQSLYGVGRRDEAAASLAAARAALPDDPATWLLSARLARLENRLAEAQGFVERAAALAPGDLAVGLEAGVIAVLGGRDDAARRSWQSVVALAPQSPEAEIARGYLAQLGPAATPSAEGR